MGRSESGLPETRQRIRTVIHIMASLQNWRYIYTASGKDVQAGPKLTVVRHIPNHPTTFARNFECEMIFTCLWPFRVRLSVVRVLGLVLGLVLSLVKCFMFNT